MRRGRLRRRYGRQAWWEWKPTVIDVDAQLRKEKAKTRPVPRMTMREMLEADRREEEERRHPR